MNKSAYKRHADKSKNIINRIRENEVVYKTQKWKKWGSLWFDKKIRRGWRKQNDKDIRSVCQYSNR